MKLLRWSIEAYDGLKIMAEALENIKGDVTREKKREELQQN